MSRENKVGEHNNLETVNDFQMFLETTLTNQNCMRQKIKNVLN